MRPTTRSLVSVAGLIFVVSVMGLVLAVIFQWPTQFDGSDNPNVTVGEAVTGGTVTSLPLLPWIALAVFAFLARSRRWWGTLAVVVLSLLGVLFIIGGLGEAFAPPTPYVPRVVLIAAGVVYGGLGLALVLSGIAELTDRVRGGTAVSAREVGEPLVQARLQRRNSWGIEALLVGLSIKRRDSWRHR